MGEGMVHVLTRDGRVGRERGGLAEEQGIRI